MEAIIPENAGMTKRVSIRQIRLSFWKALKRSSSPNETADGKRRGVVMTEILHELFVQVVTFVFMSGVIVLAVFLGHKFRDFMDKRKSAKTEKE